LSIEGAEIKSMTVLRGFSITVASGAGFAVVGTLIGWTLGVAVPDYYRMVFRIPPDVELDPVHVGIGLGLTQGLVAGLVIGLVIVVTVAWYESRKLDSSTEKPRATNASV
jgi:hypothetical protein